MVKSAVALLFAAGATAEFEEIVAHVNSLQTTWKAKVPTEFDTLDDVKALCGTILPGEEGYEALPEKEDDGVDLDIPEEFDVRTNWPSCAKVAGHVRDQSDCGSCWAHGATEAFNDRYCIATGSTTLLSTEDSLANSGCGSCNGGSDGCVFRWIQDTGVVSGGDYVDIGKGDTCAPYSLPTCQHHNWKPPTPEHPACPDQQYPTPSKFSRCKESGYPTSFSKDKVKGTSSYSLSGEDSIKKDVMQYGSVGVSFTVYSDFPAYESGVYHKTGGSVLGGHAVKLIGWGTENGTPYWLIVNSWNEDWGNKGLFKIRRGTNECGIESGATAGHAGSTVV